jgi:hypothetical protein
MKICKNIVFQEEVIVRGLADVPENESETSQKATTKL